MQRQSAPTFDEWVEYCFTQGPRDFAASGAGWSEEDIDPFEEGVNAFERLDPRVLAEYIIRLFRSPAFLADRYAADQIGDGVWFLFGVGSCHFHDVRSDAVPPALQVDCIASVATLYTDLFDRVCCKYGTEPDGKHEDRIDGSVYMIWDMDCIEGAAMFPDEYPRLVEPTFGVLESVLAQCRMSTCLHSALHGLGHLRAHHPERVERIIDHFVANRTMPQWIRDYARDARTGCIQ